MGLPAWLSESVRGVSIRLLEALDAWDRLDLPCVVMVKREGKVKDKRVCPHAQTTTTSAPIQDIRKRSQKVRTVEAGIGNQDQRKRNQVRRRTAYPSHSHIKTYDGSEDPEDHLKIFQAAAKTER
ncbi:hypothetical protein Tco_0602158 [Tanacetum coccineum]